MNELPDRKTASRMFRGITFSQLAVFLLALGLLLVGVGLAGSQWTHMQAALSQQAQRIATLEAVVGTNSERLQNQHIRLSTLELYTRDTQKSLDLISRNTSRMVEMLSMHVFPRAAPDGSIEVAPKLETEPKHIE